MKEWLVVEINNNSEEINMGRSKIMKKLLIIIFLLTLIPFSSGCGVTKVVGAGGYAASQSPERTVEIIQVNNQYRIEMEKLIIQAKIKHTELYVQYKIEMEKLNLEREKAGLKPKSIMGFEEWRNLQPLSLTEWKLIKEMKEQEKVKTDTPT
ncbi:MAG: hypothetical protein V2A65_07895 [Candidatus Omnitrophota bacterium]